MAYYQLSPVFLKKSISRSNSKLQPVKPIMKPSGRVLLFMGNNFHFHIHLITLQLFEPIKFCFSLQTETPIRLLGPSNAVYKLNTDSPVPSLHSGTLKTAIDKFEASIVLNSYLAAYLVLESSPTHYITYNPETLYVISSTAHADPELVELGNMNSSNDSTLEQEGSVTNMGDILLKVLIAIIGKSS